MLKKQRNTTQMKEQTRNTVVQINEEDIGKYPEKEFKIMIVKMIKNLETKREKMQESIKKELEELKNKHTKSNKTITEIKNTLEGIKSRISEAKGKTRELEDKTLDITSEEQNKVKRTEDSLRDLWDNIRRNNIRIIGIPEVDEKKKVYEKGFEETIVENFPNIKEEIVNQVQDSQSPIHDKPPEKHTKTHTY